METRATETRRGILRALTFTAVGASAWALSACQAAVGDSQQDVGTYQPGVIEPPEVVPLRAGVSYQNIRPSRVAAVRLLQTKAKHERALTSKAPTSL